MVSVGKKEGLNPWVQENLISGLIAVGVVVYFQGTIDRILALAVFVPVLIGQDSNTGVQTLSVALRGTTRGDLRGGCELRLILKKTGLGLANGAPTGVTAGIGVLAVFLGLATWMV
jgi:magnesium transporter